MAEFSVTVRELNTKAEELQNLNTQFMNQVSNLEETESTLNGMWEGEAKQAFDTAFHNDITQMHNFYNAIAQYIAALQNIAVQYSNAEARNVEIASTRNF